MAVFEIIVMTDDGMLKINPENLTDWAEDMELEITGTNTNHRQRKELLGHPKISGFVGPCWGGETDMGEPVIRYEETCVYDALCQ